jgi:hypothetical protein
MRPNLLVFIYDVLCDVGGLLEVAS